MLLVLSICSKLSELHRHTVQTVDSKQIFTAGFSTNPLRDLEEACFLFHYDTIRYCSPKRRPHYSVDRHFQTEAVPHHGAEDADLDRRPAEVTQISKQRLRPVEFHKCAYCIESRVKYKLYALIAHPSGRHFGLTQMWENSRCRTCQNLSAFGGSSRALHSNKRQDAQERINRIGEDKVFAGRSPKDRGLLSYTLRAPNPRCR